MACIDLITIISNLYKGGEGSNTYKCCNCKLYQYSCHCSRCRRRCHCNECPNINEFYNPWTKSVTPIVESPRRGKKENIIRNDQLCYLENS